MTIIIIGAQNPSNLTIQTSPDVDTYPVATWVRIACKLDHLQPQTLKYRWIGSCYNSGEVILDIGNPQDTLQNPYIDEQSWAVIWVTTTPTCLDYFRCIVYEHNEEIDSKEFYLHPVSGELHCMSLQSYYTTAVMGLMAMLLCIFFKLKFT